MMTGGFRSYIKFFLMAVLLIAVYKTFDSLGYFASVVRFVAGLLMPVFRGVVIALIAYPLCLKTEDLYGRCSWTFVCKKRRVLSVITVYMLFVGAVVIALTAVVPGIVRSIRELATHLPDIISGLVDRINSVAPSGINVPVMLEQISYRGISDMFLSAGADRYIGRLTAASGFVVDMAISVIVSVYIIIDRTYFLSAAGRVFRVVAKPGLRRIVVPYMRLAYNLLYRYVTCVLLDALIVAVLVFVVLIIIDVRYELLIALMVGMFNIIPYFGAVVSGVIAVLAVLVTCGLPKAVIVGISVFAIQQADGNFINPALVSNSLKIKPFWTLVAIMLGGGIFGFLGMFLAVPVMALLLTIARDFLEFAEKKRP